MPVELEFVSPVAVAGTAHKDLSRINGNSDQAEKWQCGDCPQTSRHSVRGRMRDDAATFNQFGVEAIRRFRQLGEDFSLLRMHS